MYAPYSLIVSHFIVVKMERFIYGNALKQSMDRLEYSHQLAHQDMQERIRSNELKESKRKVAGAGRLFKDLYELHKLHELGIAPQIPPLHPENKNSPPTSYELLNRRWMELMKHFM